MRAPQVMPADISIRRVAPSDAPVYRSIRLEGLQNHPEAFGSSFETENAQTDTWFAERLAGSEVLGAFQGTDLVGVVGLRIQPGLKEAHKGLLWGMYVRPHVRRAGVGKLLVGSIIEAAKPRVELLQLVVWQDNHAARRLYENFGFVAYGLEVNALKHNGIYYNEILMTKVLAPTS
ncbi:GNAT family N-acetyltransferase [Bradyrhizobium sp. LHD-71]|uniref:GNAT family N-acetyltransferase n=1 Tax=Bradyrhizobium sp. LHD-71 TaxID=3072141 RepID=UPI00280D84C1|nr:GNAT family N-acetyltransferase [Bradyrhizobium sp. LHD-71]MDQ8726947.1 GNAT family N-acetyltransferase [Bradyrhizobium sp. LHD-71]